MTKDEIYRNKWIVETAAKIRNGDYDKLPGKLSGIANPDQSRGEERVPHLIKLALARIKYLEDMKILRQNGGGRLPFGNCNPDYQSRGRHSTKRIIHGRH